MFLLQFGITPRPLIIITVALRTQDPVHPEDNGVADPVTLENAERGVASFDACVKGYHDLRLIYSTAICSENS